MSDIIIEGTWEEVAQRADELAGKRVRLTVLKDEKKREKIPEGVDKNHFYFTATPEEWRQALDALAEKNRGIPVLPPEAFERESLYEESW
ncbi:MAG: hypothetical protein KY468_20335 [Armatimonadetes bacterium]|nr:hypothetical protein [Armatimonadota bacterium]